MIYVFSPRQRSGAERSGSAQSARHSKGSRCIDNWQIGPLFTSGMCKVARHKAVLIRIIANEKVKLSQYSR